MILELLHALLETSGQYCQLASHLTKVARLVANEAQDQVEERLAKDHLVIILNK